MSLYLLDTNILTDLARNPFGACSNRLKQIDNEDVFTSVIVAGEVEFGILKYRAFKLLRQMERIMETIDVQALPLGSVETYSELRVSLETRGQPIGDNDMWIAAHALSEDAILVSNNIKEFSRIPNLKVENWMQTE
jgi:tRNA(fMet)-specific endonuclease VapC